MKGLIVALALLFLPAVSLADPIVALYAGANGVWFDDHARPADFELGGNARASLSPHISLVGASYYGFDHEYLRGSAGVRITATDVNDQNFSVGAGMQYHASSDLDVRPTRWAPDVSVGFRPSPNRWPAFVLTAQGAYFMEENQTILTLGGRYSLGVGR